MSKPFSGVIIGLVVILSWFGYQQYIVKLDKGIAKPPDPISETKAEIPLSDSKKSQVKCDIFEVNAMIVIENPLTIQYTIKTDLPDDTNITGGVYRNFSTNLKGDEEPAGVEYINNIGVATVGEAKNPVRITIRPKFSFKESLGMSKTLRGFEIKKINDNLTFNIVVPVYQKNPLFGEHNKHLEGNKVKDSLMMDGSKIVEDSVEIYYPLTKEIPGFTLSPHFSEKTAEIKKLYIELMSFKNNADFKQYGFSPDYKYNAWMKNAKRLSDEMRNNDPKFREDMLMLGITAIDLELLGLEYLNLNGSETPLSKKTTAAFDAAFKINSTRR